MATKGTVLLVDADHDFVHSATELLAAHGYRVVSASDGPTGLALIKQQRPELAVLDFALAMQTEGFECRRRIPACQELRSMPVLLVTGNRQTPGLRLDREATWLPVARMLHKPLDPTAFLAAVGALLRRRGALDWTDGVLRSVRAILADKDAGVQTIEPQASVLDAVELMEQYRIGCLPVTQDGTLVGIFTERDCMRRVLLHNRPSRTTLVRDVMTAPVVCVSPDDTIEECMSLMTHKRIRHLPVTENDQLIGIISIGDLVRAALAQKRFMIEQLEHYITSG